MRMAFGAFLIKNFKAITGLVPVFTRKADGISPSI